MKRLKPSKVLLTALAIALAPALAMAQQKSQPKAGKPVDFGKSEYETKCASCHGLKGKGDGPASIYLNRKPSDLSLLAKNNNGVLPVERMYEVITGGVGVPVHGTRDMPVWGTAYRIQAAEHYVDTPYDPESYVRGRVLTLIEYISRIQTK